MNWAILISASLLFPSTNHAADAEYSYKWIAANGKIKGCIESSSVQLLNKAGCYHESYVDLACLMVKTEEVITDLDTCRKRLPTEYFWESKKDKNCAEFAALPFNKSHYYIKLGDANGKYCGHIWAEGEGACYLPGGQFDFHPLNGIGASDLIQKLLEVKDNETVPKEVWEKYGDKSTLIATTLVYRKRELQKKDDAPTSAVDYFGDSEIQMAFPHEALDSILKNGFLNQHQIVKSNGCLCPDIRAQAEDKFAHAKLEESYKSEHSAAVNKVRPKYAYFTMPKLGAKDNPFGSYHANYGNIFAVMGNHVKDRATFSFQDSLGMPDTQSLQTKIEKLPPTSWSYMEAQIWGELTTSDVKHFIVNCPVPGMKKVPNDAIEKLKQNGFTVYACELDLKVTKTDYEYDTAKSKYTTTPHPSLEKTITSDEFKSDVVTLPPYVAPAVMDGGSGMGMGYATSPSDTKTVKWSSEQTNAYKIRRGKKL